MDRQAPGMMSALVNALRGASGMPAPPPQQAPQQPDLMTAYRQYVLATQEQGGTPMPMQQWAASQRGQ